MQRFAVHLIVALITFSTGVFGASQAEVLLVDNVPPGQIKVWADLTGYVRALE